MLTSIYKFVLDSYCLESSKVVVFSRWLGRIQAMKVNADDFNEGPVTSMYDKAELDVLPERMMLPGKPTGVIPAS